MIISAESAIEALNDGLHPDIAREILMGNNVCVEFEFSEPIEFHVWPDSAPLVSVILPED